MRKVAKGPLRKVVGHESYLIVKCNDGQEIYGDLEVLECGHMDEGAP
jgi:hypothetical protein